MDYRKCFNLIFCYLLLLTLHFNVAHGQTIQDSNLPIVIINTDNNADIPDEPKVGGKMTIIYHGSMQRNYISDTSNMTYINYKGRIAIEKRGSSSQSGTNPGKYSYSFETRTLSEANNNVSLIGMPPDNDWVLYSGIFDKALIRNMLSYSLSNKIGRYAPRTLPCELILNGDYIGIYFITEKIKRDKNRVDITKMETTDNSGENVTGGYLFKVDKSSGSNNSGWTSITGYDRYQYDTPDDNTITPQQKNYIKAEVDKLETAMNKSTSGSWADPFTGYPNIIDVRSFTDQHLLQELAGNLDMLASSMFYSKDRNGKIVSGPIWDHDLAYGNHSAWDAWRTDVFFTNIGQSLADGPFYYQKLMFQDMNYRCQLYKRWQELRQPGNPLSTAVIMADIDSMADLLREADVREQARWSTFGKNYFNSPDGWETRLTYQSEIDYMKDWLNKHLVWLDNNLPFSGECNTDAPPNLIVNEIMYNASGDPGIPNSSKKYNYIELKNAGADMIDLQGIFFSSGLTYKFSKSTIPPNGLIVLAADSAAFINRYGFKPFGQFSGSLSNTTGRVILETAMGTAIDSVFYDNKTPWPNTQLTNSSIELKEMTLNNNIPDSWFTTGFGNGSPGLNNNYSLSVKQIATSRFSIFAYPNPLNNDNLAVEMTYSGISEISLLNISGRQVMNTVTDKNKVIIPCKNLTSGIYILKIKYGTDVSTIKLIINN